MESTKKCFSSQEVFMYEIPYLQVLHCVKQNWSHIRPSLEQYAAGFPPEVKVKMRVTILEIVGIMEKEYPKLKKALGCKVANLDDFLEGKNISEIEERSIDPLFKEFPSEELV